MFTHDNYIDRRIFFFSDVLLEHGCEVKLFADEYFETLCKDDPSYVIRPEICRIVREYDVPLSKINAEEKNIVSSIKAYQNKYYNRNKMWADKVPIEVTNFRISVHRNDYSVIIRRPDGTLAYNKRTDSWIIQYDSAYQTDIIDCESAVRLYLEEQNIKEITRKYNLSIEETDGKDGKLIWLHPKDSRVLYVYDVENMVLSEYSPMTVSVSEESVLSNEEYEDFCREIYDYSRILSRINLELKKEKPDIVYVADLTTLPIAIMLKEKFNCKIIMDCHEWWYKQTVLWEPYRTIKQQLSDLYEKRLYPKCDLCITVGKYLAGKMQESIGCNFEVIYSCMSNSLESVCNDEDISLIKRYKLRNDAKIAIFQGGMSTHRNLDNLARATKYLDEDAYLLLLTTGDYQDTFKRILNREGSPERVIWGGWITQKDLLKYTRQADLGIIPYTAENDYAECFVPNKLMEYVTTGLPILFDSSMQELKLVAGENQVGYGADLGDPVIFGREMNRLLHDRDVLNKYKSNFAKCSDKYKFSGQKLLFESMLEKYCILEDI